MNDSGWFDVQRTATATATATVHSTQRAAFQNEVEPSEMIMNLPIYSIYLPMHMQVISSPIAQKDPTKSQPASPTSLPSLRGQKGGGGNTK